MVDILEIQTKANPMQKNAVNEFVLSSPACLVFFTWMVCEMGAQRSVDKRIILDCME